MPAACATVHSTLATGSAKTMTEKLRANVTSKNWTQKMKQEAANVVVISVCMKPVAYCDTARANFEEYTALHGYALQFQTESLPAVAAEGRPAAWNKPLLLHRALFVQNYTYALVIDSDALFMNMAVPLSRLYPRDGKHITINGDLNCFLNSGVMMWERAPSNIQVVDDWWKTYPSPGPVPYEQGALVHVLKGSPSECRANVSTGTCCVADDVVRQKVDMRQQREMNSYMPLYTSDYADGHFQPGDFILHFAGVGMRKGGVPREEVIAEYAKHALHGSDAKELANLVAFEKEWFQKHPQVKKYGRWPELAVTEKPVVQRRQALLHRA